MKKHQGKLNYLLYVFPLMTNPNKNIFQLRYLVNVFQLLTIPNKNMIQRVKIRNKILPQHKKPWTLESLFVLPKLNRIKSQVRKILVLTVQSLDVMKKLLKLGCGKFNVFTC